MDAKQLAEKLVSWIKDEVLASGHAGVVMGMSGGIDSSVLAVLCYRAFQGNMLGVIMPCHSRQEDIEHALLLSSRFSITTQTVRLEPVFDALRNMLPGEGVDPARTRLAEANLKPRLRMATLYYFANQFRYMVAGASNRSELYTGYFTKYGDGGVDIMPLGNLVKGQVRELAKFLGIPRQIIDKPPSAGLWDGQTDEGELGFTYEDLDRYLLSGKAQSELKQKIESMITTSAHKRRPPPILSF